MTAESSPRLVIPRDRLGRIEAEALVAYPGEGCGVLLGEEEGRVRRVRELVRAPNRWGERNDRYAVDPDLLRDLQEREDRGGPTVLGFYHSHPDAEPVPSATDREHGWPWYLYLIVGLVDGEVGDVRAWEFTGPERRPEEREIEVVGGADQRTDLDIDRNGESHRDTQQETEASHE
jgi:proteasome lid subunit RPN8/RPN11